MISTYEFGKAFFHSYNQKKRATTTAPARDLTHQTTDLQEHLITDL